MTKPINKNVIITGPIQIWRNGKDRKRKVMVETNIGIVSARRAYYKLYHPEWNFKGRVIHLDNNDLNFECNNLVLLTDREANNLVHFNNKFIVNDNPDIQKEVIKLVQSTIVLKDLGREVFNYE